MRIGIDLGGTKTEALLIDKEGNKVFSKRIPTEKNYQGTIKGIINLVNEIECQVSNILFSLRDKPRYSMEYLQDQFYEIFGKKWVDHGEFFLDTLHTSYNPEKLYQLTT